MRAFPAWKSMRVEVAREEPGEQVLLATQGLPDAD